jgi:transcription initiation factor TFIID TATA-box-binding protein
MIDMKIANIVSTTKISTELNLGDIALAVQGTRYNKGRFPGLIMQIKNPKTTFLLFQNGKVVIIGAKSTDDLPIAAQRLCEKLLKHGFKVSIESDITIKNIVATSDIGTEVNLMDIALSLGLENVEYEPEQFPGLVYWCKDHLAVFLIFNSGKFVCLGTKSLEQASTAIESFASKIHSLKLK